MNATMKREFNFVGASMRVSAETRLNASTHIQMRRAPRYLDSCIQQSHAIHVQVRQRGHHFEAMPYFVIRVAEGGLHPNYGLVGIPMMGAPPVTGSKILPPSGIPMTGAPPVTGMMICGPRF